MKILFYIFLLFAPLISVFAQRDSVYKPLNGKFEVLVGSGFYTDLFNLNILAPKDNYDFSGDSYSDRKQSAVKLGVISKAEVLFHSTYISAFSFSFSKATWRSLYGKGNDPLEVWKLYKRYEKRIQFAANYYRKFRFGKTSNLNSGIGFMVQGQQFNNNGYIYRNGFIEFPEDNNEIFWDPLLALNVQYLYRVNKNLSLGANLFTAYTFQIGIENAAIMGTIALDMKGLFKRNNLN